MISGNQKALMTARLNVLRLGASRLAYIAPTLVVIIGGIDVGRAGVLRIAGLQIVDHLDGEPNLATMRFSNSIVLTPAPGMEIKIGLGSAEPSQIIFAGHIQTVQQVYEGDRPVNRAYDVTAMSYEWLLNKQMVTRRYVNQNARAIAQDLIANYTTDGFTTDRVDTNLPVLDELTLNFVRVSDALDTLARRIGGYWYVDYGRSLHLFINPTETAHAITNSNVHSAHDIAFSTDVSPTRTRVIVQGAGARTTAPVAAGGALVPVDTTAPFSASGGTALYGTTRLTYTGRVLGNVGSNVASTGGPGAPTVAVAPGVGGVVGIVQYRVTFRASQGETTPGAPSNAITAPGVSPPASMGDPVAVVGGPIVGTVYYVCTFRTKYGETTASPPTSFTGVTLGAPSGAPSVSALPAPGRLVGTYRYRTTYSTRRGETLPGGESQATAVAFAVPAAPVIGPSGAGVLVGTYGYKVTFVTALGETTAGAAASRTAAAFGPVPGGVTLSQLNQIGALAAGSYSYRLTYVTQFGETALGSATAITVAAHVAAAPLGNLQPSSVVGPLVGSYRWKVAFVSDRGETLSPATSSTAAAALTPAAPAVSGSGTGATIAYAVAYYHPVFGVSNMSARTIDTDKGTNPVIDLNGLPAGCGAYIFSTGTVAAGTGGTAPLFKVAELGIGETQFTHTTQTGPGATALPATLGRYGRVESIPAGPSGTTARRVYRTQGNGSTYLLVGQIDGNAGGETFLDGVPDSALTVTAPTSNPAGKPVQLTNIPTGPTGTLARRVYRTRAGGSDYFRVGQIENNTFGVTYTDDTPDAGLTLSAPSGHTAGGEAHAVALTTGPAGTIARRLYRTEANRSIYRRLAEIPDNATTGFTDTYADAELGEVTEPLVATAGGQNIAVSSIPTGPGGSEQALLTARTVYRSRANGVDLFVVRRFSADDGTTSFVDDVPDASLGDPAPTAATAGGYSALLPVPTLPAGTTGVRFYRTVMGGSSAGPFYFAAQHTSGAAPIDSKADQDLGADQPPTVSDAGGAILRVSAIPLGPAGVTARRLYRTKAGGAEFFFVAQLSDNTTTEYLDDNADGQLNDLAPTEGGIGALVGDTSLTIVSAAAFPAGGGWVRAESQVLRYAAVSGATLTGIPASGVGAIVAAIRAGAGVVTEPQLIGVAGLAEDIPEGTTVNLLVTRDDVAAQAALAALIGGGSTGIFEEYINDDRLSQAEAEERGDAKLLEVKDPIRTVTYRTRDVTTQSGRRVDFNLVAPTNLVGSFKIQQVTITDLDPLNQIPPLRQVIASSRRESFEALVRLMKRQAV